MSYKNDWKSSRAGEDAATWLQRNGVEIKNGKALLYKAVDHNLHSYRSRQYADPYYGSSKYYKKYMNKPYTIGAVLTDASFKRDSACGAGLHLSTSPRAAKKYFRTATRYLECEVSVKDINVLANYTYDGPKCKVPTLKVVREVKLDHDPKVVIKPLVGQIAKSRKSAYNWDVVHEQDENVVLRRGSAYKIVAKTNLQKSFALR